MSGQRTSHRRLHVALNREGALFVFFLCALGGAAVYSGKNGLVLLFCVLFVSVLASVWIAARNFQKLEIERRFAEDIFANSDARIDLIVKNAGNRDVLGLHIFEYFDRTSLIGPVFVRRLSPGQVATARYVCRFRVRGAAQFLGYEVRSRFPLPFLELRMFVESPGETIVYPEKIDGADAVFFENLPEDLGVRRMRRLNGRTIREAENGRLSGRVLWKLSAGRNRWIEEVPTKGMACGYGPVVAIDLSLPPERFERQLSQTTSFILACERRGISGGVRIAREFYAIGGDDGTRKGALEALAMLRNA